MDVDGVGLLAKGTARRREGLKRRKGEGEGKASKGGKGDEPKRLLARGGRLKRGMGRGLKRHDLKDSKRLLARGTKRPSCRTNGARGVAVRAGHTACGGGGQTGCRLNTVAHQ